MAKKDATLIAAEIPNNLLKLLDKWAEENCTNRSSAIRMAIKKLVENK